MISTLAALRIVDPQAFRARFRAALIAAHGNLTAAARTLDVDRRTLQRWIDRDATLTDGIELRGPGRYPPAA